MSVYVNGVEQVAAGVGGLYGINVETLAGNKTLTPNTNKIYEYLDGGGASRTITLATAGATAGDRFVIRNNGTYNDTHYLEVMQAAISLDKIYAQAIKEFIFDGTNWIAGSSETGQASFQPKNIGIGASTQAYDNGLAIGERADGHSTGIAVGNGAVASDYGIAIGIGTYGITRGICVGYFSEGYNHGVAIGYYASSGNKVYSISIGERSYCYRTAETSINVNAADTDQENNVVQGRWEGQLAGGAGATEIFCGGQANERFTIRPSSVLAFTMIITARNDVANKVARYSVHDGLIKRDAAGNTVMVLCTVTVDYEDTVAWDCAITADDVHDALIITVTGDGTNITQWAAVMNGVETHF